MTHNYDTPVDTEQVYFMVCFVKCYIFITLSIETEAPNVLICSIYIHLIISLSIYIYIFEVVDWLSVFVPRDKLATYCRWWVCSAAFPCSRCQV